MQNSFQDSLEYISDFLHQYPRPTEKQARIMLADAGVDRQTATEMLAMIDRYGARRFQKSVNAYLTASYSKADKVLQDQIDHEYLSPDYLMMVDESTDDPYTFQEELSKDGILDEDEMLEDDKSMLMNDSAVTFG